MCIRDRVYGGRWEVVRPLGEGGQAHVYAVKDLRGEHVSEMALKWLMNVKRRDRFIAEAAAGLRLQHENIVKVIDHSTPFSTRSSSPRSSRTSSRPNISGAPPG